MGDTYNGPKWAYHQELIEATPKCIRDVCVAAGKDGWELTGMLAVMLPPSKRHKEEVRRQSGLLLSQTVAEDLESTYGSPANAINAQMQAAADQPTPAVMLMFKRILVDE